MKEVRYIVFEDNEVIKAVLDRRHRQRESLPVGTVQKVTFSGPPTMETTIHLVDDYGKRIPMVLLHTEVAAALIGWCLNRRVPMPMSAERKLELVGGSLALSLTINMDEPRDAAGTRR